MRVEEKKEKKEKDEQVIEIQENVNIEQENEVITLEKGDKIKILSNK